MATKKPDPRKYEKTTKEKKQMDAMSADIAAKFGFNAPTTKVAATPKPNIKAAEKEFKKMIESGKVKDLEAARRKIQKKYGARPNGMTN